ncbi:hypothetical protein GGI35DRAFT_293849 [Trichoderma velutinum]
MRGAQEYAGDALPARFERFSFFFFTVFFFSLSGSQEDQRIRNGTGWQLWGDMLAFGYQLGVIGLGIYRDYEAFYPIAEAGDHRITVVMIENTRISTFEVNYNHLFVFHELSFVTVT